MLRRTSPHPSARTHAARLALVTALAASGLVFAASVPAAAAYETVDTRYVSADGSDTENSCSSAAEPCATINGAIDRADWDAHVLIHLSGTIYDNPKITRRTTISGAQAPAGSPAVIDGSGSGTVLSNTAGLTLEQVTITHGSNRSSAAGGIYNIGDLTLRNSTVTDNYALTGGGIYSREGAVTLIDSTVSDNTAGKDGDGGGGIHSTGPVTLVRSTVSDNSSDAGYGGVVAHGESLTMTDSTVSGNSAGMAAGVKAHDLTITNSTITGNVGLLGGGVTLDGGHLVLIGSTVAGNTASGAAGINNGGTATISGSIVGPNSGQNCQMSAGAAFVSRGYNIDPSGTCGLDAATDQTADAQLAPLADNGGPTRTMMPPASSTASNQIPVGTTSGAVTLCARVDQRGVPGPGAGTSKCAIGAVEPVTYGTSPQAQLVLSSTTAQLGVPQELTTAGGSGAGAVTFTAANGTATGCRISSTAPYTLAASELGTCMVIATKAAHGAFLSVTSAPTVVTITKRHQEPVVVTSTRGTALDPIALTTSGGSGTGTISYTVANASASGCAVGSAPPHALTASTAGTCLVTATKAADEVYLAATSAATVVTFAKRKQAPLVVGEISAVFGDTVEVVATGGSGTGAISYTITNWGDTRGCSISDSAPYLATSTTAGDCTVRAEKAGDAIYEVAAVQGGITFTKAPQQMLTVTSTTGTVGTPLTLTHAGGSGTGQVAYSAKDATATGCTVSGTAPFQLTASKAGTCIVHAAKAEDVSYLHQDSAATTVTLSAAAVPPAPPTVPKALIAPSAARNLKVGGKAKSSTRKVTWRAPSHNGGAAIRSYTVTVRKGSKTLLTKTVTSRKISLKRSKLKKGKLTITVRARNSAGLGRVVSKTFTVR